MYVPKSESEVKATQFEKNLAQNNERKIETSLMNKATLMGSTSALDSFNFLMKSLWVHSTGKKHHKLRELV